MAQFDEGVQRRGPCHTVAYTLAANWRADRINNPAPGPKLLEEARSVARRVRLPDWPELC